MTVLKATPVSSDKFTFSRVSNTMSAEISDFQYGSFDIFRQIYDDAADAGFSIRSEKTCTILTFYYSGEDIDREGDVQAWHFKLIAEDVRKHPAQKDLKVVIFND